MIRVLFFAGLGLLAGFGLVTLVAPSGSAVWAFPVGLTLTSLMGVFWGISRSAGTGLAGASDAVIAAARAEGRLALARIDAVRQTGLQINDQPVLELELTVAPSDRPAFRVSTRRLVPLIRLAEYVPGARVVVALLTHDGVECAILDEDPNQPPWDRRTVPSAYDAGELRSPRRGVARPDGSLRGPWLGAARRGRWWRVPLYVVVVVLAAAAVVAPFRGALAESIDSLTHGGSLHANLWQERYLVHALDSIAEESGSGVASDVTVRADRISAEVPLQPGQRASDDWEYRRGTVSRRGPSTIQPELAAQQFQLDAVHWDKLWWAVQRCAASTNLPVESAYASAERAVDSDVHSDTFARNVGPVQISVSLSDDYGSGHCTMNADASGFKVVSAPQG